MAVCSHSAAVPGSSHVQHIMPPPLPSNICVSVCTQSAAASASTPDLVLARRPGGSSSSGGGHGSDSSWRLDSDQYKDTFALNCCRYDGTQMYVHTNVRQYVPCGRVPCGRAPCTPSLPLERLQHKALAQSLRKSAPWHAPLVVRLSPWSERQAPTHPILMTMPASVQKAVLHSVLLTADAC